MNIFQKQNGEYIEQQLDLRNYDSKDIKLEYIISGADLLIPLHKGDYLYYYPSAEDRETPISGANGYTGFVTTGMIFYTEKADLSFSNYELRYYLEKPYFSGTEAVIFTILMQIWLICFIALIIFIAVSSHYEKQARMMDKAIQEILSAFSGFVDAKDSFTNGHSQRVAYFSKRVAEQMGLDEHTVKTVNYAALMHDIGKCYLPDSIIASTEPLDDEELALYKTHGLKGAELLSRIPPLVDIADGAEYHHERFDGTGYPMGLVGKDIPLSARIIAVTNFYDSHKTDRTYRKGMAVEEVMKLIKEGSGTLFDPDVVDAFLDVMENINYPEI